MFAFVTSGVIQAEGRLPLSARRLDTGQWVLGLRDAPVSLQQACGWFEVVDVVRPADTATLTYERSVQLVGGVPTVYWSQSAKTAEQLKAETVATNTPVVQDKVRAAITANLTAIAAIPTAVTNVQRVIDGQASGDTVFPIIKRMLQTNESMLKQLVAIERLLIGSDLLESVEGT